MTRLNNRIKEEIVEKALIKAGIPDKKKAIRKRRAAWAEAVRIAAIGGAEMEKKIKSINRRFKKAMSEFPEDLISRESLFRTDHHIYMNVGGCQAYAQFNGTTSGWPRNNRVYKVSPAKFTLEADAPLAVEFRAIEAEEKDVDEEESNLRANVIGALSKVGSVKRLLDMWPEAKELLPSDLSPVKAQLPAVRTEDLNAMIGLPSEA